MAFSVQEKLALMMTSAGSQRALASLIGVSHQRVGRWLTIGGTLPDGSPSNVQAPTDPAILRAINVAFGMHVDVSRAQAKADHLIYSPDAPVFLRRLHHTNGDPGMRATVDHPHFISDKLRGRILEGMHATGQFMQVSVRSKVDRRDYFKATDGRIFRDGTYRTKGVLAARDSLDPKIHGSQIVPVYTPYTPMGPRIPGELIGQEIDHKLRMRHQASVGKRGTVLADQWLFQTASDKDKFGVKHAEARRGTRQAIANAKRKAKRTAKRKR